MPDKKTEIIKDVQAKLNVEKLDMNASLNDLGLDSLDIVEYLLDLEEKYHVEFPSEDMENLKTVGDVISLVESKIK